MIYLRDCLRFYFRVRRKRQTPLFIEAKFWFNAYTLTHARAHTHTTHHTPHTPHHTPHTTHTHTPHTPHTHHTHKHHTPHTTHHTPHRQTHRKTQTQTHTHHKTENWAGGGHFQVYFTPPRARFLGPANAEMCTGKRGGGTWVYF